MALILCPECKKEISSRAASCPNCGCPIAVVQTQNTTLALREQEMLRWRTLGIYFYCLKQYLDIYVFLTNRIDHYIESQKKLGKKTGLRLKELKTDYKEAKYYIENGGTACLDREFHKLFESTTWKKWKELNDQIGEYNEKIDACKSAISVNEALCALSEDGLKTDQWLIKNSRNVFDKRKNEKQYKERLNTLNNARYEINKLNQRLDDLLQEYREICAERKEYDEAFQRKQHLVEIKNNYSSIANTFNDYNQKWDLLYDEKNKMEAASKNILSKANALADDFRIIPEQYQNRENVIWLSKYVNSTDEPVPLTTLYQLMSLSDIRGLLKESNDLLNRILNEQQEQKKYIQSLGMVMLDINERVAEMNENIHVFEQRIHGDIVNSTLVISESVNNASYEMQREMNNQSQDIKSSIGNLSSDFQSGLAQHSSLLSSIADSQAELARMNIQEIASLHADLNLIF